MKELTIEQKAKRYDEAIELVNSKWHYKNQPCVIDVSEIFPELKESEDEKIRKRILFSLQKDIMATKNSGCNTKDLEECVAWLEKQGESKVKEVSIWKHWKDGICGNGNGKQIYLIKQNGCYSISSCLGFECDYIELSELDKLLSEKQGEQHSAIRWYDVSLIPQEMKELLVEWDSEDATWHEVAFYRADTKTFWNGTRQVKNVTRWCYIIDLLEKQGEQKYADKVKPKFEVGDVMRTIQEAANNITSGLPVVVSIDNEYYHCNNELIAIKDQDSYEYPPMNTTQIPIL